jgi:hypothetical protein
MKDKSIIITAEQEANVLTELPEYIVEAARLGGVPEGLDRLTILVSVRQWPEGKEHHIRVGLSESLLEMMRKGAQAIQMPLLPPAPEPPLDLLRARERKSREWSEAIEDLDTPLWLAMAHGLLPKFAIEYRLVIRINAKWGVAPEPAMTPRLILTTFGFDPAQFTLYHLNSSQPLPPDTPITITRGECFEAQKDGRYGSAAVAPARGCQTIEDDTAELSSSGVSVRLVTESGQRYVEVRNLAIPSPPWSKSLANILIAVPATYPQGGLDGFYLERNVDCGGTVPNQQSVVTIEGRSWALISWHYANGRPWDPTRDDLASHIVHCRGFFLRRGVRG